MQFQFLLHLPLLLCFNGNNVDAKRSLSTSDSILNYLVEQSLQAKSDLSRITNEDIQIGKRTIKISTSSTNRPRILDDEIVLIFHADGSIKTYDTQGQSSVLMRAGNFQIDSEIFNLVFPGFSMDTAGETSFVNSMCPCSKSVDIGRGTPENGKNNAQTKLHIYKHHAN